MKKLERVFKSKTISNFIKIKTFNVYIACVFLYNSELWGVTATLENQIDAFQRRVLRYALGIQWPKKITNEKLMGITKAEPWSVTIKRRRLTFLGHVMRLHNNTPVKIALKESFSPYVNKTGRPANTWLATIRNDLKKGNINIDTKSRESFVLIENLTSDRTDWNNSKKEAHAILNIV